jgi:hypothetical protein
MRRDFEITVIRSDGEYFVNGEVKAGTTLFVSAQRGTELTIADAGAVDVWLDGKYVGLLGAAGSAVERMGITPDVFEGREVLPETAEAAASPPAGTAPSAPAATPATTPAAPPAGGTAQPE